MTSATKDRTILRYQALALAAPPNRFFPYLIFRYVGGGVEQRCIRERSYTKEEDAIACAHRYAQGVLGRQI